MSDESRPTRRTYFWRAYYRTPGGIEHSTTFPTSCGRTGAWEQAKAEAEYHGFSNDEVVRVRLAR